MGDAHGVYWKAYPAVPAVQLLAARFTLAALLG